MVLAISVRPPCLPPLTTKGSLLSPRWKTGSWCSAPSTRVGLPSPADTDNCVFAQRQFRKPFFGSGQAARYAQGCLR